MNADTFNTYSVTCPICHHTSIVSSVGMFGGLFTCPHCHTNFVISSSGNYVRDPFCLQKWAVRQMLRRQSHPLARIGRDLSQTKRFPLAIIVSSILFLSLALAATHQLSPANKTPDTSAEELIREDPFKTQL